MKAHTEDSHNALGEKIRAHIVINGTSTGGLPAAYGIKHILGKGRQVTVISNWAPSSSCPPNP